MTAGSVSRRVPDHGGSVCSIGLPGVTLSLGLLLRDLNPVGKGCALDPRIWFIAFDSPSLGETRRPVTKTTAQPVIEQQAPPGPVTRAFTFAGEAVQLAWLNNIGWFQPGDTDRVMKV
jgi:hypothetical protein